MSYTPSSEREALIQIALMLPAIAAGVLAGVAMFLFPLWVLVAALGGGGYFVMLLVGRIARDRLR